MWDRVWGHGDIGHGGDTGHPCGVTALGLGTDLGSLGGFGINPFIFGVNSFIFGVNP